MAVIERPSPNHDERLWPVSLLVLHYTGMESGEAALARLRDSQAKVSAHYMVTEDGSVVRMVTEDRRAWHAGISSWQGQEDLNSRSIGIEIVNGGHDFRDPTGNLPAYTDAQIDAVITLCKEIITRHAIRPQGIVGHSDIAPARKSDPGEHFPWQRLAKAGVGIWPDFSPAQDPGPAGEESRLLHQIGYDTSDPVSALRAFQRRWLPACVNGLADGPTRVRLQQIVNAYR